MTTNDPGIALVGNLLNVGELAALLRFKECADDGEGYDVPKEMMQRLAAIGVLQRRSGPYYQPTELGMRVLDAADLHLARAVENTEAARDVMAERRRQIEIEKWSPDHDSEHADFSLAKAAAAYAFGATVDQAERDVMEEFGPGGMTAEVQCVWPRSWAIGWFKPKTRRADLVKAGALILAEIERLDRATADNRKDAPK